MGYSKTSLRPARQLGNKHKPDKPRGGAQVADIPSPKAPVAECPTAQAPTAEVNPDHYIKGPFEPIKVMKAYMTPEEYRGFLYGSVLKYLLRHKYKGAPLLDLRKAFTYLKWLVEHYDQVFTLPEPLKAYLSNLAEELKGTHAKKRTQPRHNSSRR